MNFKPDETLLMAYLYDELVAEEKRKVEEYLAANPQAAQELSHLQQLRKNLSALQDKEVIVPPLVWSGSGRRVWQAPYFKTIAGIAASLALLFVTAWFTNLRVTVSGSELRLGFGKSMTPATSNTVTAGEVQQMIEASLRENNNRLALGWNAAEQRLAESVRQSLASQASAGREELVKQVARATDEQIRMYVNTLQEENTRMIKDYLTLTASEQHQVIEELLVDFSKYLNQQRLTDLQMLQTRLTNIEQNTDLFKQETEQILTSIITSVEGGNSKEIRN